MSNDYGIENCIKVKTFDFPSFEEWRNNEYKYSTSIGVFKCVIEPFCWGNGETTYAIAVAADPIPTNIYVNKIIYHVVEIKSEQTDILKVWYENIIKRVNREWADYMKTYIEEDKVFETI